MPLAPFVRVAAALVTAIVLGTFGAACSTSRTTAGTATGTKDSSRSTAAPVTTVPAAPTCPVAPQPGPDPAVLTPAADPAVTDPMLAATAALRCLPQARAATEFVDRARAKSLIDKAVSDDDRAEIERITPIAELLGWIEPGADLLAEARALSGGLVLGLYAPTADRLFVVTDNGALTPTAQRTLVHEWVHALQDESYGLDALHDATPDDDLDRAAALSAVVEGDAEFTSRRYTEAYFSDAKRRAAARDELALGGDLGADVTAGPLLWDLYFPYLYGATFVADVVERSRPRGPGIGGGRGDVTPAQIGTTMTQLYGRLPTTSTEILHPERYRAGFRPATVESADLAPSLGVGWSKTFDGTWGEYASANLIAGFSGAAAGGELSAVDGWLGDNLSLWRSVDGTAALVLATRWASATDAARFVTRVRTAMAFDAENKEAEDIGAQGARFADGRVCRAAADGDASIVTCTNDPNAAGALAALRAGSPASRRAAN